jgi:multicomponent Na+:H+ antiporter subunit D
MACRPLTMESRTTTEAVMLETIPPIFWYIIGAVITLIIPNGRFRATAMLLIPLAGIWQLLNIPHGDHIQIDFLDYTLTLFRVDKLSFVFGLIFNIAAFLSLLYAWHVRDPIQQVMTVLYAGAAIGAVFAGDLISLFIFWEATALTSVFLIWARGTEGAYHTGMRYLIIQVGSGVLLLAGTLLLVTQTGSIAFIDRGLVDLATLLIFIAFGIKCAFPLLHNWLQDAYPASTATGTVVLSAFTTKLAIYALARAYPGTEILVYIGCVMMIFPVFFAAIENNLRKVLAYSLNNQLGFMVVGIGIGTPLALNGTAAHAFAHILYKALLFMSMGAVLHRTGTTKASELGGLYRTMPLTMIFCVVGAASISAFPLFSGFISKSLIQSAAANEGYMVVWVIMLIASVGVLEHSGIKIPFFTFFGHDSGKRPKEAPWNMLLAMFLTSSLCIGLGIYPAPLYAILPFEVEYDPYTTTHVVTQFQVLLFALLAFCVLYRSGVYPVEIRAVNIDFDWIYRRGLRRIISSLSRGIDTAYSQVTAGLNGIVGSIIASSRRHFGPIGLFGSTTRVGSAVAWISALLLIALVTSYSGS